MTKEEKLQNLLDFNEDVLCDVLTSLDCNDDINEFLESVTIYQKLRRIYFIYDEQIDYNIDEVITKNKLLKLIDEIKNYRNFDKVKDIFNELLERF